MGSTQRVKTSLALGLAYVGIVLLAIGLNAPASRSATQFAAPSVESAPATTPPSPSPRPAPSRAVAGQSDIKDTLTGRFLPESDPMTVSIPTIGVRSALVELGLDATGAMEVPRDPALAGWFSRSAAPGALGPAVIAGHVTWNRAPGVFYRIGALQRGDRVTVARADGTTAIFIVDRVARYSKERFPHRTVYGAIDHAGLRLITCGGAYDVSRHRYVDNVVVFARLDAVSGHHRQ